MAPIRQAAPPPLASSRTLTSNVHDVFADIALVVTEDFTNESRDAIHAAVRLAGGAIYLTKPPNIMVGRIPALLHPALVGKHGIQAIYSEPVDITALNVSNENARGGVRFFNWVVSGARAAEEERVKHITPGFNTLGEHVFMPTYPGGSLHKMTKPMYGHWPNQSMVGVIGVDLFMIESVGTQDEWTWTGQHIYDVEIRLHSSLYWWADIAAVMQISPAVNFVSDVKYPWSSAQQVPFEAVRRTHEQDFDWIGLITANHGVTTGNDTDSRVLAYIDLMRWRYNTNYAFPLFVVYNPDPAPPRFAPVNPPQPGLCAYAKRGLYVQLLFKNCYQIDPLQGWPPEQIGWVAAHEIPHVFWACDENFRECPNGCLSCYHGLDGPRPNQDNYNCDGCSVSVQTQCIMDSKDIDYGTWVNHSTCGITRLQIGWPY